ncbi:hypothetical protein FOYG_10632 [Fusarium oxysporum NRRL 32931]|uniref:Uncharacterized protein n=1 Tax=Fusarium oxysporum NRRL 32931 TaxID=660029 RepID=W9HTP8_FUSOX|nr:hypothetical protein FOYG_10632 [Fusarium oxysporum NRRL 32931]
MAAYLADQIGQNPAKIVMLPLGRVLCVLVVKPVYDVLHGHPLRIPVPNLRIGRLYVSF